MNNKAKKDVPISRRGLLPLLASSLLVPFLGLGNSNMKEQSNVVNDEDQDYQTLLKPDGTVVRVKKKTVQESKIIQKDLSNTSLLNWLDKK
ncbi:MAG: hypothetical protein MUO53_10660 [Maribacter sp.]|nr:hypothetical protein [Maribacter sp.]